MKRLNLIFVSAITTVATISATPSKTIAQQSPSPPAKPSLNCLSGYPQTPEQGRQPISRYSFAVGLDHCLNEVTQPLQQGNFATKTDLNQLTQRQQELNQQLQQLHDRIDPLDSNSPMEQ
ncbi:hypothetical protein K9N68_03600 [Kovacikia minuta CCNUW1]|uniref:hypothetical protein n=1 Tax=Kovacikia minuta TaxID=2931930 RepID=UPI001CD0284A|nr:hypothetical protein [Kovacikia minuta]UBF27068.1 hypothetical protein K9N68_03600 [Kovacikia minuta CCNUW1]